MRKTTDYEYFRYLMKMSYFSFLFRRPLYRLLVRQLSGRVLDVGCGIGEFLQMYPDSCGIDTNRYCVGHCRQRGLRCSLGSASRIPFPKDIFDGVITLHVLEHLTQPEKAISEMRRVLKKRGKLIIVVPLRRGYERDPTHVRFWSATDISKLLRRHGFEVETVAYSPTPVMFLNNLTTLGETRVVARKMQINGQKAARWSTIC